MSSRSHTLSQLMRTQLPPEHSRDRPIVYLPPNVDCTANVMSVQRNQPVTNSRVRTLALTHSSVLSDTINKMPATTVTTAAACNPRVCSARHHVGQSVC